MGRDSNTPTQHRFLPTARPWADRGVQDLYPSWPEVTAFRRASPSSTTCPQSYLLESGLDPDQPALVPSSCRALDLNELIHLLGSFDVRNL